MLGWNNRAPDVVRELDEYLAAGSTMTVVADLRGGARGRARPRRSS